MPSGIDFSNSIAQLPSVLERISQSLRWCKLIAAFVVCAVIPCSEPTLPQLLAQIASLDPDHGVSLHACSEGVDLVLSHHDHSIRENDEALSLVLSPSEPAHVIHLMAGAPIAKQPPLLTVSDTQDLVPYFSTAISSAWRTFVPPLPLAYSRPPPDELSILPLNSRTLLLI
jgi:hypothetical protein